MATRLSLAEEIQRNYVRATGAVGALKSTIDRREIFPLINQVANELLSTVMMASIKVGDLSVPSSIVATYNNVAVATEHGRYFVTIPVYPLILPRNMGVYSIVPQTGTPPALTDGIPFIPITQEDWDVLMTTDINDTGMLEGQVAFYVEGRKAFFTKNPTVTTVKLKLLISDPNLIGDTDPYPITPELEAMLVLRVLDILKSNSARPQNPNG
jgi:hypothetical protein